ncbi:MAG TPA: hypothetical protein VEZ40_08185 [Pyrinomonadaceae bacterium]|nr:hypothetical protein [Pyrinomonadaceae bacterium]
MITKETIKSEIEKVPEERLDELFRVVRTFTAVKAEADGQSFMSRLKNIQIDAPEDFSVNLDQYLTGQTTISNKPVSTF